MSSPKRGQDYSYEKGVLSRLFVKEIVWLCSDICAKAEYVFKECVVPDEGFTIQNSPEIHSAIHSIIGMSANLKKLITTSQKRDSESGYVYKARLARVKHLSDLLAGVELQEIMSVKARNSLEHFDEYLDQANADLTIKPIGTMAAYNMIISSWDATDPRLYPIRLYVADERKFYNMKTSIDIGKIASACKLILARLKPDLSDSRDGRDGGMIPV